MALASIDAFGSIPLATDILVRNVKEGVTPWKSWADTQQLFPDHTHPSLRLEERPSGCSWARDVPLVDCRMRIYFFAFFGFGDEAFKHYHLAYTSIARRIGYSKPSGTLHDSPQGYAI